MRAGKSWSWRSGVAVDDLKPHDMPPLIKIVGGGIHVNLPGMWFAEIICVEPAAGAGGTGN